MPSTLHCVLLFGKYRLLLALADENSVQTALKQAKKAIDRRDAIRERPPGFKSFEENSDAWVDCGHVFGLLTRDRPGIWGIMPHWQGPGPHQRSGQIDAQTRHRVCRCRLRNGPGAADRRHFATIAFAAIYSCAG